MSDNEQFREGDTVRTTRAVVWINYTVLPRNKIGRIISAHGRQFVANFDGYPGPGVVQENEIELFSRAGEPQADNMEKAP